MSIRAVVASLLSAVLILPGLGLADTATLSIVIRDQQFLPSQLKLPAGVKAKLAITNDGPLPAEFESFDLSREVVLPVKHTVMVFIGPLKAGRYEFFNDFNHDMRGTITVTPAGEGGT
ncbi:MAG: cupredoxin domain-containing protein [Gammaproteobacteria bacterium]